MLGPFKALFVFHPETVERLMSSSVHINKSREYEPLLPWLGPGLLLNHGEKSVIIKEH